MLSLYENKEEEDIKDIPSKFGRKKTLNEQIRILRVSDVGDH
jgi:hypothetical protein